MDKLDFKKRKSKYAQRHDLIELRDQRALLSFRRMFKMSVMGMGGGRGVATNRGRSPYVQPQTIFYTIYVITVDPWYNEPLYNEDLGITDDFLYPSNSKATSI